MGIAGVRGRRGDPQCRSRGVREFRPSRILALKGPKEGIFGGPKAPCPKIFEIEVSRPQSKPRAPALLKGSIF